MSCKLCGSDDQSRLSAETAVHVGDTNTPHVFLFPVFLTCLNCGFTEFVVPETDRLLLIERLGVKKKGSARAR
jgi:hypothetical protein